MRNVINISLPVSLVKLVKQGVKEGRYASISEFFRHLLRQWEEKKLLAELRASQKEIREGRGKVLHSLKDLR